METTITLTRTIGIDIGDKYSYLHVLEADGMVSEQTRIATTPKAVTSYFSRAPMSRVALEVGTHSRWVDEIISGFGHEVLIANPRKLRAIYESDDKSDQTDCRILAEIAQVKPDLLRPIKHRGEEAQAALALVRVRDCVVSARTKLINMVRGTVKPTGERLPKCSADSFDEHVEELPEERREVLEPMMGLIARMTDIIHDYDRQIAAVAKEQFPETQLMQQIAGVGPVTSLTFAAAIEDPNRFPKSRKVGSYVGLRPRKDESGEIDKQLRITKSGDELLRRLLVCSSHYILGPFGPDTDLRRWGMDLAARGGKNAMKRACVGVARKLAVLLLTLWKTGADYEPLRQANLQATNSPSAEATPTMSAQPPAGPSSSPKPSRRSKSCPVVMNP